MKVEKIGEVKKKLLKVFKISTSMDGGPSWESYNIYHILASCANEAIEKMEKYGYKKGESLNEIEYVCEIDIK
jgi:hypothetical protein